MCSPCLCSVVLHCRQRAVRACDRRCCRLLCRMPSATRPIRGRVPTPASCCCSRASPAPSGPGCSRRSWWVRRVLCASGWLLLPARLPACPPARLPARLAACPPPCLHACLPAHRLPAHPTRQWVVGVPCLAAPSNFLSAVLQGASGAGKTTLMDVLAGRKTGGQHLWEADHGDGAGVDKKLAACREQLPNTSDRPWPLPLCL